MGTIYKSSCSNCKKIKGEASLGVGMSFPQHQTVNGLYGCDACGKVFAGGVYIGILPEEPESDPEPQNPCPKCGKEVSEEDDYCTQCRSPLKNQLSYRRVRHRNEKDEKGETNLELISKRFDKLNQRAEKKAHQNNTYLLTLVNVLELMQ